MSEQHLLSARQMAHFVADGFLRFDALVPAGMNAACQAELESGQLEGCRYNNEHLSFESYFASTPGYAAVLNLPAVQGIIRSLVGPEPGIDHCAVHIVHGLNKYAQFWHADATIDPRTEAFDIQMFYYPHDTPRPMGGTMFLPGSQFRRVHETSIAHHQNIRGQLAMTCPAGTVVVAHHNLWHCGQPNSTPNTRYMVKLRLNPRYRQCRLFDLSELGHPDIHHIISTCPPWMGAEHRLEILQRLRLWRAVTGTQADTDLWLHRLDNQPTRLLREQPAVAGEVAVVAQGV